MQQSQQEYTIGIFGGFYNPDFSGWRHTDSLKIKTSSLEQAIQLSEEQVRQKLRQQFNIGVAQIEVLVNYVKDSSNQVLYQTAWDEIGPLITT